MKGLDVSFSRISKEWAVRRVTEGYRVFVACLWTGGYKSKPGIVAVAEANLRDARDAGMITAGYLNTNPWFDAAVSLNEAKIAAGAEWDRLGIVFNDVEIPGVTEVQIKSHCEAITGAGKRPAIYSASWFWSGKLGNPKWDWLRAYKVWNAYYDGDPDIDFNKAPWGPWTSADVIGEQYGGTDIEGVTIDWNVFDEAFFTPQPEEDDMPTLDEIRAVIREEIDSRRQFVRIAGTDPVYEIVAGELVYAVNGTVLAGTGAEWPDVLTLDPANPEHAQIARLPVRYTRGIPRQMGGLSDVGHVKPGD